MLNKLSDLETNMGESFYQMKKKDENPLLSFN